MIKATNAGERRHQIEIKQPAEGVDDFGTPCEIWSTFARPWAAKLNHSGRRFFQAQQMNTEITDVFNIRYMPGITTQMRVVYNGQTYEIIDVDDREGRHMEIDLHCKAVM